MLDVIIAGAGPTGLSKALGVQRVTPARRAGWALALCTVHLR
jgi:hypothetical protein